MCTHTRDKEIPQWGVSRPKCEISHSFWYCEAPRPEGRVFCLTAALRARGANLIDGNWHSAKQNHPLCGWSFIWNQPRALRFGVVYFCSKVVFLFLMFNQKYPILGIWLLAHFMITRWKKRINGLTGYCCMIFAVKRSTEWSAQITDYLVILHAQPRYRPGALRRKFWK